MKNILKDLLIKNIDEKRVIFHIDVNSAYLSWTAVKLLKETNKDIRNIPSVIGGDQTKRSGVVLARSNPAKQLGIKTGEPIYFALKKSPSLYIHPADFILYEKISKEFNTLLYKYTEIVEKYSIDESYLDVTDYLFDNTPLELARIIQKDIFDTLGFTVNIGISNVKLLAKTASDFEKPNKIHTLYFKEIKEKLWPLDISSLFSVGKKTQSLLRKLQINTIKDIAQANPADLERRLGKAGIEIWKLANGIDESKIIATPSKPKSISHAETLSTNLSDINLIKKQILKLTETLTTDLRKEQMFCKTIRLTLRDKNFNDKTKQKTLKDYTDNTSIIYDTTVELLKKLYNSQEIRLIGITLDNLILNDNEQMDLFAFEKDNRKDRLTIQRKNSKNIKEDKLDNVLDNIKEKYNTNIIKRARNINKNEEKD